MRWRRKTPALPTRAPLAELSALVDDTGPALMAKHRVPGVQMAVCLDGRVVIERAWGVMDAHAQTPVTPSTVFKACSNGKPLTAIMVLKLVDAGALDLDEPVWRYLETWRILDDRCGGHDPDGVTLRRLLSHQAGFGLIGFPQQDWTDPQPPPSARAIMDGCFGPTLTPRLLTAPDSAVKYCGDGFTLIQLLIEEVTRRDFAGLADELVIRPLGLRSTWFGRRPGMEDRIAANHADDGRPQPLRFYPALAASGLYTTAAELATVYAALPNLLPSAQARQAIQPQTPPSEKWMFAMGFAVAESNGRRVYKHAGWNEAAWGAAEGIGPRLDIHDPLPTDWPRAAAAVLSNSVHGKPVCQSLLGAITQWIATKGL